MFVWQADYELSMSQNETDWYHWMPPCARVPGNYSCKYGLLNSAQVNADILHYIILYLIIILTLKT